MKSKILKSGSVTELEVTLDQKEFQGYWQTAYDHALSNVHLKGFRPGAAPKELAEKAVDKEKVFEEAARHAVRFSLNEITQDKSWTIIDTPKIELKESPVGLQYKATLSIFPEIKLPDYKKIAKKVFAEKKEIAPTTDKEAEDAIQHLRESRAKEIRVNREAQKGDVVEIDVESTVGGEKLDNFKNDKFVLGKSMFVPGFDERMEGHKEGEELIFSLTTPEDFRQENIRGKKVDFRVKVNAVFGRELPELNDAFAQSLGKFENLSALRSAIAENIILEKQHKEREKLRIKALDEIIAATKIDIPDVMVEKTLDQMVGQFAAVIKDEAKFKEFREKFRDKARHNVAANLVLYKIAKDAKIDYNKKEGLDNNAIFEHLESL